MSEDRKLLLSVAGVVVVGVIGIALIGAWSLNHESTDDAVAARDATGLRATPASYTREEPTFELPSPEGIAEVSMEVENLAEEFHVVPGENYVARGLETYNAREFDKAAAYFRAEVEERPDRPWTQYMLGLSLWKAGELDEAAGEMARACDLDERSIKARVNLSRIGNDRGEFAAALDAAQQGLAIDPEDASALFLEGRSLANLGRREEALQSLRRSIEIDPDNGYVQNLYGLTLIELDRETEAIDVLRAAAELEPDVAYIQNNLGMAMERCGLRHEAVEAYRRAVALDSGHERAAVNLARLELTIPVEPETEVAGEETVDVTVVEAVGEAATGPVVPETAAEDAAEVAAADVGAADVAESGGAETDDGSEGGEDR